MKLRAHWTGADRWDILKSTRVTRQRTRVEIAAVKWTRLMVKTRVW